MHVVTQMKTINMLLFCRLYIVLSLSKHSISETRSLSWIPDPGSRLSPSTEFNSVNNFPQHECDEADPIAETMCFKENEDGGKYTKIMTFIYCTNHGTSRPLPYGRTVSPM
jgi:hypothetical protein